MMSKRINIHAVIPLSMVNGPGGRMVIFFQGCRRGCPGCFNPDTHSFGPKELYTAEEIFEKFLSAKAEGVTVSGGEPFSQPEGLLEVLIEAKKRGLTTVVYTGFIIEELKGSKDTEACLGLTDVLIDGAYDEALKETTLLARGSTNQRLHFLSKRYGLDDFYMPGRVEISIGRDGVITETGFSKITLKAAGV